MRTRAEPQARPPPSASISTRSPWRIRPSRRASVQCQRHRSGRGIGVAIDGDYHPLRRQAELPPHGVDDAQVGLVRHQPVDIPPLQPVGRERLIHRFGKPDHGVAEHLAPIHDQMPRSVAASDGAVDIQDVAQRALRMQMGRENAAVGPRRHCRRAGTRPRRRRRTTRRCRDPASSGCASRPRCRSPAHCAPGRCGSCCRRPTAHR